ncbi:MAG: PPC domain-containing protein [Planctomycetaceae bacterium]
MADIRILSLLAASIIHAGISHAGDPPVLNRLTPAGGQRGSVVTATLDGKAGTEGTVASSRSGQLQLSFSEKRDSLQITIPADASPGVHWVRLHNDFGASELRPFIVGVIPEIVETESNDLIAEAVSLPLPGVTVNGVLQKSNDVDSYAIRLTRGTTLVAGMTARRILDSPMDAILQVTDSRGTVVAQNDDDVTTDPLVTFTAPQDGVWNVRTFAFPSAPNSTIGFAGAATYVYRLTMSTDAVVHHTDPVVRQAGSGAQRLQLKGWNITVPEAVLAKDSNVLTGQFALPRFVHTVSEPVVTEDRISDGVLSMPTALCGRLTDERADEYLLQAEKGDRIRFRVECRRHGSLMDPVLRVYDSAGTLLKEVDDISRTDSDIDLVFTAPANDQLRLVVADRFLKSGDRHFYVMRIAPPVASCQATVAGTAFSVAAGGEIRIPLTIDRQQGFAEKLSFEVSGLPEQVTATATVSEKSGDTAKKAELTLQSTGQAGWSGPVQIRATGEESGQSFPAVWSAPDGSSIDQLWLTVTPAAE